MEEQYTRLMRNVFTEQTSSFRSICCREEMAAALREFQAAPRDRVRFQKNVLRQMGEPAGVDVDALIADPSLLSEIPTRAELTVQLLEAFHAMYKHAPGPEDYMARLVHRLAPEFAEEPVRTAILKQFILGSDQKWEAMKVSAVYKWARTRMPKEEDKRFNKLSPQEKAQAVCAYITDDIFSAEALMSSSSGKWQLVQVCDNLAGGRFLTNGGKTRVYLYYFAIMFGMTVCLTDADVYDPDTDIEKNLFEDYYSDNLMRYFDDAYRQAEFASAFEPEPTGEGINYKNFAEAAYLYYLYRTDLDLRPGEKIDRANALIRRCAEKSAARAAAESSACGEAAQDKARTDASPALVEGGVSGGRADGWQKAQPAAPVSGEAAQDKARPGASLASGEGGVSGGQSDGWREAQPAAQYTEVYRERLSERLAYLTEEELEKFLLENYDMPSPDTPKNVQKIMVANEENTAYSQAAELIEELSALTGETFWRQQEFLAEINRKSRQIRGDRERQLSVEEQEYLAEFGSEMEYLANSRFGQRLSGMLREKYAQDADFLALIDRLDERVGAGQEWVGENENRFLVSLLYVLKTGTAENRPLRLESIVQYMREYYAAADNAQVKHGAELLAAVGFAVKKISDRQTKKSLYALQSRTYADRELAALLKEARAYPTSADDAAVRRMGRLVKERMPANKRITRSRLLALATQYYLELLKDSPEMLTFSEVYDDYTDTVNLYLEEARFQPFSEKNIFDVYMLLTVYLYIIENGV